MIGTYYDTNETTKLLGYQCPLKFVGVDGIARTDFDNVISAHKMNRTNNYFEVVLDGFMLGYIYGKREERAKKKAVR